MTFAEYGLAEYWKERLTSNVHNLFTFYRLLTFFCILAVFQTSLAWGAGREKRSCSEFLAELSEANSRSIIRSTSRQGDFFGGFEETVNDLNGLRVVTVRPAYGSVNHVQSFARSLVEGRQRQSQLIERAVGFAIDQYCERRPHWRAQFLKKLQDTATEYAEASTYVVVHDDGGQRIDGTIRIIRSTYSNKLIGKGPYGFPLVSIAGQGRSSELYFGASNQKQDGTIQTILTVPEKLPMEHYLGIDLPRPGRGYYHRSTVDQNKNYHWDASGQIFEIGNLAIDNSLPLKQRSQVMVELFVSLIENIYNRDFTREWQKDGQAFYAYADAYSLRLYEPLGFKKITSSPIEKDGVEWWPLKMEGLGLIRLKDTLLSSRSLTPEQRRRLQSVHAESYPYWLPEDYQSRDETLKLLYGNTDIENTRVEIE